MAGRVRADAPAGKPAPSAVDAAVRKVLQDDEKLIAEFEALLEVDKLALDDQLEQHPDLLYRIGEICIERQADQKAAKRDLDEIMAKVDVDLRRDAEISDTKVTDTAVKAQVKVNPKVIAAADRLESLEYWVARWGKLESAYAARQSVMRELVTLFSNGYWSDASKPRSTGSRKSKAGEIAREALAAERRRRAAR